MNKISSDFDAAIVGGGLVGTAIAFGLAGAGLRVCILDEGDVAYRASRGNFALVWVQSKGLGMPEYSAWSKRSADQWPTLATQLQEETDIDVALRQPGGFTLCLSEAELALRTYAMQRLHNQAPASAQDYEVLDHAETKRRLPAIGPDVAGAIYSPWDGHVNSLRLFRALHEGVRRRGGHYKAGARVETIQASEGGFRLSGAWGAVEAGKIVIAAGLDNARLAPLVALEAPVQPSRGQIIVTEKTAPFLDHPTVVVRQTDEGGVMIGDSQEDAGLDTTTGTPVLSVMAERAMRMFPLLAQLNVVRTWSALRVMSPDGFPIYEQSAALPGAFVATCHSGVTLAANHALTIAPAIAAGALTDDLEPFSSRRLRVPAHA